MSTAPQLPPEYRPRSGPREVPREKQRKRTAWQKVLAWTAGVVVGILLLLVITAVVLVHSQAVHRYILRVAQEKATAALGTRVSLRDFGLHFSGISPVLDLYDVSISGAPPHISPPLAKAERLHVALTIASVLHRNWYVDDIDLVKPVVRVQVDPQGASNLPTPAASSGKSKTNLFDLGIRHAKLEDGELFYNDRKALLSAELDELNFVASYDVGEHSYSGRLGYRDGRLLMENFAPIPHAFDAEFVASPETFTLKRAQLRSGSSSVELRGVVNDYGNPHIKADYVASVDSSEFRRILRNPSVPAGVIRAGGSLTYVGQNNRPLLESVTVDGNLSSQEILVRTSSFEQAIRDLSASYKVASGNLLIPAMRARLLGGELTATLVMRALAGNTHSHATAALRSLSLKSAQALANSSAMREVGVSGVLNGTADATWGKTMDDLVARVDATVKAQVGGNKTATPAPLDGTLHANYDAKHKLVEVRNSFLRTRQTSLTMAGTLSGSSALELHLQANDLHELEALTAAVRPTAPPLGLFGVASFEARVTGDTTSPKIDSRLNVANLKVRGTAWRQLRASISLSPSAINLENGELDAVGRGKATFALGAKLQRWSFTENSPVQLSLEANQIDVGEIARGAGVQLPIAGLLTAAVAMHGSEQNPVGNGRISLSNGKIQDEQIKSLGLRFNGSGDSLLADLDAQIPAGAANAKVTLRPKQKFYEVELHANGVQLDQLEAVKQRGVPLTGVLNLNAEGKGSFDNPGLSATAEIPQLDIRGQRISGIKLRTVVADHVGTFDLRSDVVNTSILGHGTVRLTGDYETDAKLDTQVIPFEPLIAIYAPSQATN
ncbi:MAG: hypothetical protein JO356_14655, partial [Acidobacteria bacterium]|nr:hypothetical protein [Acidobacteriota bacterium]